MCDDAGHEDVPDDGGDRQRRNHSRLQPAGLRRLQPRFSEELLSYNAWTKAMVAWRTIGFLFGPPIAWHWDVLYRLST